MTYTMPVNKPLVLAKAFVTAVLAAVVLLGTPWVLVRWVGYPLPTVVPSWDDVRLAVTNGQIDQWTWVKLLAVVAWLAWGSLVAGFALEIPAAVRGGTARAVAGLGASQWLAGRMIAGWSLAASVLLQTMAAGPAGALPALPVPAAASADHVVHESFDLARFTADGGTGFASGVDRAPTTDRSAPRGEVIEVQRRDTLWSLALDHLGSGERWAELRDANVGRVMPDGTTLSTDFTRLRPGWTLLVPDSELLTASSGYDPASGLDAAAGLDAPRGYDSANGLDAPGGYDSTSGLDAAAGLDAPGGYEGATWTDGMDRSGDATRADAPASGSVDVGATVSVDEPVIAGNGAGPVADAGPVTGAPDIVGSWTTARGEHFWAIASHTLTAVSDHSPSEAEIREYWLQLMAANESRLVEPGDPDLVLPGQQLDVVRPAGVDDARLAGLTQIPNFAANWMPAAAPAPAPAPTPAPPVVPTVPEGIERADRAAADAGTGTPAPETDGSGTAGTDADATASGAATEPGGSGSSPGATPLTGEQLSELLGQIAAAPPPATAPGGETAGSGTAAQDGAPATDGDPATSDGADGAPATDGGADGDLAADGGGAGAAPGDDAISEPGRTADYINAETADPSGDPGVDDAEEIVSGSDGLSSANDLLVAGVLALGVGGGSLLLVLRALRAFRSARRRPGTGIEPLLPELQEFDKQIREVADTEATAWLAATNRLLTSRLRTDPLGRVPAVVAMRAGAYGVELLLDEPCSPVEGFLDASEMPSDPADRTESGRVWRLDPDLELQAIERETASVQPYCPGMVPFGATDAGDLLVDMELEGAVMVGGHPDHIVGWLQSIALAAALVPWGEHLEVVAIGLDPGLARLPHVEVPDDPATWARERALAARAQSEQLGISTYQLRIDGRDLQYPTLVLVGPGHDAVARSLADAASLAAAPIALLAAAPLAGGSSVFLEPDRGSFEPLGLEFAPAYTDAETIRLAADLVVDAARPAPSEAGIVEVDAGAVRSGGSGAGDDGGAGEADRDGGAVEGDRGDGRFDAGRPTPVGNLAATGPLRVGDLAATMPAPATGIGTDPGLPDGDDSGPVARSRLSPREVDEVVATIEQVLAPRDIEVQILAAQPSVAGLEKIQPKIESVVVFLAHQRVVPVDRLREQFWAASTNRSTADNAMTNVRRMLGQDAEGNPRLSFDRNTARYVLSDDIGCDWTRVQELVALADAVGDPRAERAYLAAALGLVEGQPGADAPMKHYAWLRDNHEVYIPIEVGLTDAAYRLGELALDDGDPKLARWAANQGLLVVPGQEALHRIQMLAASLAGDTNGVDAAYRAAVRSAEVLSAWEEVQPETEELYAKLTRRQPVQQVGAERAAS